MRERMKMVRSAGHIYIILKNKEMIRKLFTNVIFQKKTNYVK